MYVLPIIMLIIVKINHESRETELMLVTSKTTKHLHNLPTSISIGNAQFTFKKSVKNLGYNLDFILLRMHVLPKLFGHAILN